MKLQRKPFLLLHSDCNFGRCSLRQHFELGRFDLSTVIVKVPIRDMQSDLFHDDCHRALLLSLAPTLSAAAAGALGLLRKRILLHLCLILWWRAPRAWQREPALGKKAGRRD